MTTTYLTTGGIISNNTKRNLEDTKPSSTRTTEEVQSSYAENILGCIATVSYTLLDVYKRQSIRCAGAVCLLPPCNQH